MANLSSISCGCVDEKFSTIISAWRLKYFNRYWGGGEVILEHKDAEVSFRMKEEVL
jgi:hypothetical protein